MNPPGLEGPISRVASAAARYSQYASAEHTVLLEDAVMNLLRLTSSVDPTGRLSPRSPLVAEFLHYVPAILLNEKATSATRSKIIRLLYNLSFHNVALRRYMARELEMVGTAYFCLKLSIKEQLGPQNMIDILRLLQVLTYDSQFEMGKWTDPLLHFLVQQVIAKPVEEWMSSCIVVLCNLICRTNAITKRLQRSSSYRKLVLRIRELLNHDEHIVVVCTLVIAGYLDDTLRKCIYDLKNMHDTFLCMFNVLIYGDLNCSLTRLITCDFVKRLVVSDKPGISAVPVFTMYAENLMHYPYFKEKMQQLAELLVTLDARTEESNKLYDLFLAFCSIPNMVSPLCSAVVSCQPTRDRLTTPIIGVSQTAALTPDQTIDPQVTIKAFKFLGYLCKELIDSGKPLESGISFRQLLPLIDYSLKTTVETASPLAVIQCQTIVAGLQLTEVVAHDEEMRSRVIEVVSSQLCAHILEFQFVSNPIVLHMDKPPTQRSDTIAEWSLYGVAIVLQVMRVLAALKDFNKPHKQQYWNSLKDEHLIPFIAYAISYGDHNLVHDALQLYTHCEQLPDFPRKRLGDLVASCVIAKRFRAETGTTTSPPLKRRSPDPDGSGSRSPDLNRSGEDCSRTVNELLERIRSGAMQIKDVRMSEILATYEKKVALLEEKNQQLEAILATSERMRIQTKSEFGRSNESDLSRIRELVAENEALQEKSKALEKECARTRQLYDEKVVDLNSEIKMLRQQKESLEADIGRQKELSQKEKAKQEVELAVLTKEWSEKHDNALRLFNEDREKHKAEIALAHRDIAELHQQKCQLETDLMQDRELYMKLRQHSEEQKKRLEIASLALEEKSKEISTLNKKLAEMDANLLKTRKEHDLEKQRWKQDNERLEMELDSLKTKGQKAQMDLEKMKRLREEMLRLAGGYE